MAKIHRGISFYCYLYEYYHGAMTLEDCFREAAAAGVTGIEILADYMLPGYPDISNAFVETWYTLLDKYAMTPVCLDLFNTANPVGGAAPEPAELLERLRLELRLARRLGFGCVRAAANTPVEIVEAALPDAKKLDVKIGYEIHPPLSMDSEWFRERLELIQRTGTGYIGFIPDMGIFAVKANPIQKEWYIRRGVRRAVADQIGGLYAEGASEAAARACLKIPSGTCQAAMELTPLEAEYFQVVFGANNENPANILKYKDYFYHFHGKFYEMDENCNETSLNYAQVMEHLLSTDYEGFICSEYEGSRYLSDTAAVESCEQLRRHQVMLGWYCRGTDC